MKDNPSIRMIEIVAEGLGTLLGDIVFVGGSTTGLYIDDPAAPEPRPTDDVDCVIEVSSRKDYSAFEKELRDRGFTHVIGPKVPICRFKYSNIIVDVMPTDPAILGFSNRWYGEAIEQAVEVRLPSKKKIHIFSLPYFLATKLEAFHSRGNKDFRMSTDFEDIVTVLDGANDLASSLRAAPKGWSSSENRTVRKGTVL